MSIFAAILYKPCAQSKLIINKKIENGQSEYCYGKVLNESVFTALCCFDGFNGCFSPEAFEWMDVSNEMMYIACGMGIKKKWFH